MEVIFHPWKRVPCARHRGFPKLSRCSLVFLLRMERPMQRHYGVLAHSATPAIKGEVFVGHVSVCHAFSMMRRSCTAR